MATPDTKCGGSRFTRLARYLGSLGLLESACGCRIANVTNLSRSHLVLLVELRDGRRMVVKRARQRPEAPGPASLGAEPAIYRLRDSVPALASATPACLGIDWAGQTIVLDAAGPGESVLVRSRAEGASPELSRELGATVARWHCAAGGCSREGLPPASPWILDTFEAGGWQPPWAAQLFSDPALCRELAWSFRELRDSLRPVSIVHNDLKWDNCMRLADGGVRIIDWELAGAGDPLWDVAGIVQEHLQLALLDSGPSRLRQAGASLAAFLASYLKEAGVRKSPRVETAISRLSAARLVQSALECGPHPQALEMVAHARELMRNPAGLFEPFARSR